MERTTVFSAVLVINIFSITDSANHNNMARDIKQDSIVAHAQAIRVFGIVQMLDVAVHSMLTALYFAVYLRAFGHGQLVKIVPLGLNPAPPGEAPGRPHRSCAAAPV